MKLIQGECIQVMDKLISQGIQVDMVLTDPPYGTTKCKWDSMIEFKPMWERINKIIKLNGCIALFGSEPFSSLLRSSNIKQYKYDWYWDKITGTGHLCAKYKPMQRIESISIFSKNKTNYYPQMVEISDEQLHKKLSKISKRETYESNSELTNRRKELSINDRNIQSYKFSYPENIIAISKYIKECNNVNRVHPTQKPIDLLEYLILTYTKEGETVLDFTMGSGSTGVACKNLHRDFIGIELDEKYFFIAQERILKCVPN